MPEPNEKNQELNESTEDTTTELEDNNSETNTQDDPYAAARGEMQSLYGEALRDSQRQTLEANRTISELNSRLTSLETARTTTEPEIDGADFLSNPKKHISEIVQREIRQALEPINETARSFRSESQFQRVKRAAMIDPKLGPIYKEVETEVDNALASLPEDQLTPHNFQTAILSIYGMAKAGLLPANNVQNNRDLNKVPPDNSARENNMTTLRSSVPNPNRKPEEKKTSKIELTESQRRVAKLQGLTPEEYIAMLESDGTIDDMNTRLEALNK